MRENSVPEDLVWVLACATAQDAIAEALSKILEDPRPRPPDILPTFGAE